MRIGSLFSGAGGLDLAVQEVFGGEVVWHAEIDKAASKVLAYRFPGVPNLGDISAVDWADVPAVDVLCGGFPCQDVSAAGKRAGIKAGTRSGLWSVFADAIDELRPQWVVIENVRGLLSATAHRTVDDADGDVEPAAGVMGNGAGRPVLRAAGAVLGDLADLGYDAQWATVAAADVGAPHRRERVFILATDATFAERRGTQQQLLGAVIRSAAEPRECAGAAAGCGGHASDAKGNGRDEGRPEPARLVGGFDAAVSRDGDVALLPTPGTMDDREKRTTHAGGNLTLQGAVVGVNPVDVERHSRAGRTVAADDGVALLPTPCAQQSGNSPEEHLRKKPGRKVVTDLAILVENGLMETGGALPPTGERTVADGRQACGCGDRRIDHDWFANPDRFDDGGCRRCRCEGFWPSGDEAGVALLPTPSTHDKTGARSPESIAIMDKPFANLNDTAVNELSGVALLPTPVATDAVGARNSTAWRSNPDHGISIADTLTDAMWKLAADRGEGARSPESIARMDKPFANLNDTAVNELLSTPQARDSRGVPREDYNQACLPRDIIECDTTWGKYEPAIRRWERLTRPAPKPTEPGVSGLKRPRLNPQFSEWMMGWPLGWVTSIGLTRKQQLQIIGNGVVPQQACYALRWLLKISQATEI